MRIFKKTIVELNPNEKNVLRTAADIIYGLNAELRDETDFDFHEIADVISEIASEESFTIEEEE